MVPLAIAYVAAAAFGASLSFFLYAYLFLYGPPPSAVAPALSASVPVPSTAAAALAAGVNVCLFTLFALHHSVFARTRVKGLVDRVVPPTLERSTYVLVASVLFTLVCWYWRNVPGIAWSLDGIWRPAGYAVQLAGIVLTIMAARALDVWELAGVRHVRPGGRPVVLKSDGLYGFVRHPLYFAWVLLVFGAPDMTMTRLSFATISTLYLAAAIPFEERSLIETFGSGYASYRERVRWRMLPGIW